MKKKLMILLLSIIAVSAMTSCGNDNTATETLSTHIETMEYKTMEPPDDGWTIEELLGVTYLCGTQLSYPLTLESLGEDFSLNTDKMSYRETEKSVIAGLMYKDEFFATIWQTSTNTFSEITNDMPISAIEISFYGSEIDDPIVMNGITFSVDVEGVMSAFGEPNEVYADNSILTYYLNGDEGKTLEFTFDSGDMVGVQLSTLTMEESSDRNSYAQPDLEGNTYHSIDIAVQNMCFYGVDFSFPCEFGEFSDDFELDNGFYFSEVGYTYYDLIYNDEVVASIGIEGEKSDQNKDKEIVMLIIEDEQLENLIINNNTCAISMDEYISILGTPDVRSDDEWKSLIEYCNDEIDLSIIFNDDKAHELTLVKECR